jgi:hypothetical protein
MKLRWSHWLATNKAGLSGRGSWSSRSLAETLILFLEIRQLGLPALPIIPRTRADEGGKFQIEGFASRGQQSTSRTGAGSIDNESVMDSCKVGEGFDFVTFLERRSCLLVLSHVTVEEV